MGRNGRETWLLQWDLAAGAELVKCWLLHHPLLLSPPRAVVNNLLYRVIPLPRRAVFFGSDIGLCSSTLKK